MSTKKPSNFNSSSSGTGNRPRPNNFNREKQEEKEEYRLNDMIRVTEVRLVGDNIAQIAEKIGEQIEPGTVYATRQVRQWAEKMELDVVEISPNAVPPVVRIIDYRKFLYDRRKKEKEMKANAAKTVIKEIRFGPNTDEHDFEFKLRHARSFLEEGAKVKAFVNFKGRAIVFKDRGELILLKFIKELDELGSPESLPRLEGRRMQVMISPKKQQKKPTPAPKSTPREGAPKEKEKAKEQEKEKEQE